MQTDPHSTARGIIDASFVSELSAGEERLRLEHLRDCIECQEYSSICARAVSSLKGLSFEVDPDLNAKVLASLAARARQIEAKRPGRTKMLPSFLLALAFTVVGSFVASRFASPLAAVFHVEQAQVRMGWLAVWVLPSLFLSIAIPVLPYLSEVSNQQGEVL